MFVFNFAEADGVSVHTAEGWDDDDDDDDDDDEDDDDDDNDDVIRHRPTLSV